MEYRWGCDTCSYKAEGCEKCKESPFLSRPKARWDPSNALPQDTISNAPSFYPTAEEFKDPLGYLQKIAPQVAPYGIAHVVPPQGCWHPPSPLLDPATGQPRGDLFIPVRRQPTHLLCRRFPTSDGGPPLPSSAGGSGDPNNTGGTPAVGGAAAAVAAAAAAGPLVGDASPKRNLGRKRYEEEPRMGMLKVAKGMGMSGAQTEESFGFEDLAHPFTLQEFHIYNTWAMQQHFSGHDTPADATAAAAAAAPDSSSSPQPEQQQQAAFRPSIPQIEAEFWRIVEKAEEQVEALYGSDVDTSKYTSGFPKGAAAVTKIAGAPPGGSGFGPLGGPTDASKQKDNWAADAEACCCSCHAAAAASALGKRTASGSMAQAGPSTAPSSSSQGGAGTSTAAAAAASSGMCPCLQAVLDNPSTKVCWACAVKGYSLHPWNINNIPTAPDSVLRFVREGVRGLAINGMMVPWLYAGSCFSSFSWHIEDHGLYSINYNHLGAPKVWYGVPGYAAAAFDTAMQDALPHLFAADPNLLHRLTTLVSPKQLAARGIPVCRVIHQPGSFVITFPDAYHAGFNSGFNVAEAVNFAMPDWLPCGTASVTKYKLQRRPTTFGYDAMLVNIVAASVHANLQKQWAEQKQRQQAAKKQKKGLPPPAGTTPAAAAAGSGGDGQQDNAAEAPEGRESLSPAAEGAAPASSSAAALPAPTAGEVVTEAAPHPAGLLQYLMPAEAAAAVAQALQGGRLAPFQPADCSLWADWYRPGEWWKLLQLMDPALAPLLQPAPLLIAVGAGAAQQLKTVKVDKDPGPRLVDLFRHVELAPWQRALPAAEQKLLTLPPSDCLAVSAAGELVVRLAGEAAVIDDAIKGGHLGGVALMRGSEMARCPTTGVHTCTKSCECRVCGCDLTLAGVVSPAVPGVTVCPLHAPELPGSPSSKVLLLRHLPGAVQQLLQALQDQLPAAQAVVQAAKTRLQQGVPSSSPGDAAAAAALKVVQDKVGQLQEERRQQAAAAAAAAKGQQAAQEEKPAAVPAAAEPAKTVDFKPEPAAAQEAVKPEQLGGAGGPAPAAAAEEKATAGAAALQHLTKSIQLLQERLSDMQQQLTKFEGVRRQLEAVTAGNPTAQGHLTLVRDKEAGLQQRYKHLDGLRQELVVKAETLRAATAAAAAVKALPLNSSCNAAPVVKQEQVAVAGNQAGQQEQQVAVVKQEPGAVEPARSTSSGDSTHTGAAAEAVSGPAATTAQSEAAGKQVVVRRLGKLYEPQQLSSALFEDLEEPEEEQPAVKEEQEAAAAAAAAVAAAAAAVAALDADKGQGSKVEAAAAAAVEVGAGKEANQQQVQKEGEVREWALKKEVKEDEFGFVSWGDAIAPGKAPATAAAAGGGSGAVPQPQEGDEGKRRNRGTTLGQAVAAVAAAQRPDSSDSEDMGDQEGDTSDEEFKVGGKRNRRSRPRERKRVRAASPAEGSAAAPAAEAAPAPAAAAAAQQEAPAGGAAAAPQKVVASTPAAPAAAAAAVAAASATSAAAAAAHADAPVVPPAPAAAVAPVAPVPPAAQAVPQQQHAPVSAPPAPVGEPAVQQQQTAMAGVQEAAQPLAAAAPVAAPPAAAGAPHVLPVGGPDVMDV